MPLLLMGETDPIGGVDLKIEVFINHAQALARLIRGEAELLFSGTSQGWENYLSGGPLVHINTGVWGISYLIGRDESIRSVSDLRGKKIALPFPGSPLDFQTRFFLKASGLDPEKNCTIIYSPPPQAVPMLLMGQIDAAPLPEPLASKLVLSNGLKRLLDYKKVWAEVTGEGEATPQVSLFSLRKYADASRAFLIRFNQEWEKATRYTIENPELMASRFAGLMSLDERIVAAAIRNTFYSILAPSRSMSQVISYFKRVRDSVPGMRLGSSLGDDFFFLP